MATTKVNSEFIAVNAISGTIIADNAITATHIATNSISGTLVQDSGIVTTMIANNNVTATKIVTDAIQTRHIADDQVTAAKLANSINTDIAAKLPLAGGTITGTIQSSTGDHNLSIGMAEFDSSNYSTFNLRGTTGGQLLMGRNSGANDWDFFAFTTNGLTRMGTASGDDLAIHTNSSGTSNERIRILSDGKVGIGTNSPQNNLTITDGATPYSTSDILLQIKRDATNSNDDTSKASIMLGNNSNGFQLAYGGTTDRFRIIDGGAVERFTILNGGYVGIRDTSPDAVLKVNSTGGGSELAFKVADASDNSVFEVQGGGTAVFQYGKVGIGTTSPGKLLEVSHAAASHNAVLRLTGTHASAYAGGLEWYSGYGPKITAQMFSTASGSNGGEFWINVRTQGGDALTQCFRINNAGMQGFNQSATYNGHGNFVGEVGSGYKALCFERTVGGGEVGSVVTNTSSTTYNTSSDYRLKENIRPIENGLERLNNLNPVKFDWKSDGTSSEGFIAHETQEIFPDAISGDKDDEMMQGMDYGRITPLLVKAVQEQQTIIDDLKERIKELEG